MKLRRCFLRRQLLFLLPLSLFFVLSAAPFLRAQTAAITTKDGKTSQVKILSVLGSSVQVQVGAGSVGIPISSIAEVSMPAPPEFVNATTALAAKDYPKALAATKAVLEKYKGLPVDWAQQAASMLGDIYVAMNDFTRAESAYRDFQKIYPGSGSVQADVGLARIAVSRKDYATAKEKLEPVLAQALKLKDIPPALGPAYSQAFLISGQIKEAAGDAPGALEDYLRTVTIFYHDRLAVSAAQERADALRKERGVSAP